MLEQQGKGLSKRIKVDTFTSKGPDDKAVAALDQTRGHDVVSQSSRVKQSKDVRSQDEIGSDSAALSLWPRVMCARANVSPDAVDQLITETN